MFSTTQNTPVFIYSGEIFYNMILEASHYDQSLAKELHDVLKTTGGSAFNGLVEFFKYAVEGFHHYDNKEFLSKDVLGGNLIVSGDTIHEVFTYSFEIARDVVFNNQYQLASMVSYDRSSSLISEIYFNFGEDIEYLFQALDRLIHIFLMSCIPSILHADYFHGVTYLARFTLTPTILLVSNIKYIKE